MRGYYEYGVEFDHKDLGLQAHPHRDEMSEEEARQWIAEWDQMGGKRKASVVRRFVSEWTWLDDEGGMA